MSSYDHRRANPTVSQGRAKGYEYEHYSSNHYVHKSSKNFSAYSYAYPNPSYVKRTGLASMPPFSYGARRVMNSLPPLQMWVVKFFCRVRSPDVLKRLKKLLETWKCLKGRRLIMKKWIFNFSRPHSALPVLLLDEIDLMKLIPYSSLLKYVSS